MTTQRIKEPTKPFTPQEYLNKGYNITPCGNISKKNGKYNPKAPRVSEWQKNRATADSFNPNDNIGIIWEDKLDVDVDNPIAHKFKFLYLKPSSAIYGRKNNPRSHYLYKGTAKDKKFSLPKDFGKWCDKFPHGHALIEIRSGSGQQTLGPGSRIGTAPGEGDLVEWDVYEGLSIYDGDVFEDVSKIAFATAMTILYPPVGDQRDYCYAIACILANGTKWSDSEIDRIIEKISESAGVDTSDKLHVGTHARKQIKVKGRLMGFPTLSDALGVDIRSIAQIFQWVGVEPPSIVLQGLVKETIYLEDTAEMVNLKTKIPHKKIEFDNKYLFEIPKRPRAFEGLLLEPDFQERKCQGRAFLPNKEYPIATIKPGEHPLLPPGRYLNGYKGNPLEAKKGDVSVFVNTYKQIFGEKNWKHIEQFIAFMLQNLGTKIRWGILIVSPEGIGKGILIRTLSRILGYEYVNENVGWEDMTDKHSVAVVDQLLIVLNEVVLTGEHNKKMEVSSGLKGFWADDFCNINDKNKRPYKYLNVCNGFMFSNNKQCLHLDTSSRRYLVIHIDKTNKWLEEFTEDGNFERLYDFIQDDDNIRAIKHYLIHEVKIENPKQYVGRAPVTEDLKQMIENSQHPAISKLDRAFKQDLEPFNNEFCGHTSLDELMNFMRNTWKINYPPEGLIKEWLRENSFKWKNGKQNRQIVMEDGSRPHSWLLKDSDTLRNMSPVNLGNMHQMTRYSWIRENKINKFSFGASQSFDLDGWQSQELNQCLWILQNGGSAFVERLMMVHTDEHERLKKIRKKYTKHTLVMNHFGKWVKGRKVDWAGYFSDPEYIKGDAEVNKKLNGIIKKSIKNVPEEMLHSEEDQPREGGTASAELKVEQKKNAIMDYKMEKDLISKPHGLDDELEDEI